MFISSALVRFLYLLLGQRWAVPYLPVTLAYSFFDPRLTPPLFFCSYSYSRQCRRKEEVSSSAGEKDNRGNKKKEKEKQEEQCTRV